MEGEMEGEMTCAACYRTIRDDDVCVDVSVRRVDQRFKDGRYTGLSYHVACAPGSKLDHEHIAADARVVARSVAR